MNKVFLKPLVISCGSNNKTKSTFFKKEKLIKLKHDINLKLKEKKETASIYCDEIFYNESDYYCSSLLNSIDALEQKERQINLLLTQFKD